MPDIVLKNKDNKPVTYAGIEEIVLNTEVGGITTFYSESRVEQAIDSAFESGLTEITINENGHYSPQEEYKGFSRVIVDVQTEIPPEYIVPAGTQVIESNGTYNVREYEYVNVNVATAGGEIPNVRGWKV